MDYNPTCDDLPHVSRWGLLQGSQMDDLENCHDFYSLSLYLAERLYQKNRNRFNLLDDHVQSGVNFFSNTQEILREWRSIGEDIMEFEAAKRSFAAKRETFNSEKKGLMWRVSDAEDKLAQERQLNANCQRNWTTACERSNRELTVAWDEVVKMKAEKAKESQEYERLYAAFKEKESETVVAQKSAEEEHARVVELEKKNS
ncbi:hypothetical protein Hanom_Chr16g01458641 [Helianthus anomalus]